LNVVQASSVLTLSELLSFAVTIFAAVHIDGVNHPQYHGVLLKKHTFLESNQKRFIRTFPINNFTSCELFERFNLITLIFRRVRKIAKKRLLASSGVCPPARPPAWNNSAPTGRICVKFYI
jgi:hypothetical protein